MTKNAKVSSRLLSIVSVLLLTAVLMSSGLYGAFTVRAASDYQVTDEAGLIDALSAAGSTATTIELDADIALTGTLTIPAGADITLISGSDAESPYKLIGANGASTITVTGAKLTLGSDPQVADDGIVVTHDPGATGTYMHGIRLNAGGVLVMNSGEVSGNYVTGSSSNDASGGGVLLYGSGAQFTMEGGTICDNKTSGASGQNGGGVSVNTGTFIINGGLICRNVGTGGGGVCNDGTFTMNGGTISDNSAGNGGGVYHNYTAVPFTMNGGIIEKNYASSVGGGVCNGSSAAAGGIRMTGGIIRNNITDGYGGGVYTQLNPFNMSDGEISGNTANGTDGGGGVYALVGAFNMSGGIVDGNTATHGNGGGVYLGLLSGYTTGFVAISGDAAITNNTAANSGSGQGGGIYTENFTKLTVTGPDVLFSGNTADYACDRDPANDAVYTSNILDMDGNWTVPFTQGYNNFDINQTAAAGAPLLYVLRYDANGGVNPPDTVSAEAGTDVAAAAQGSMIYEGHVFTGWNTQADGKGDAYAPGDEITMTGNRKLFAQWASVYAVTYDGNNNTGGSAPEDSNVYKESDTVTVLDNVGQASDPLVREGYTFLGWSIDPNATAAEYTVGDTFAMPDHAVTLYAVWASAGSTQTTDMEDDIPPTGGSHYPAFLLWILGASLLLCGGLIVFRRRIACPSLHSK